jgi:hypothetical protein
MDQLTNTIISNLPPYAQAILVILLAISFLGGVISAIKIFFDYFFSKVELVVKITESYANMSEKGNLYLFNISIVNVGRKNFYPLTWTAKIKHLGEDVYINTELMPARYAEMYIKNIKDNDQSRKRLKTENIKYIQSNPVIESEKLINGYLFLTAQDYNEDKNIDSIIIEITDFKSIQRQILIDYKKLKPGDLFHDDSIWDNLV